MEPRRDVMFIVRSAKPSLASSEAKSKDFASLDEAQTYRWFDKHSVPNGTLLLFALAIFLIIVGHVFAQSTAKLEGQVVCCEECWAEADRTKVEYGTAENLLKAKSCVEGGDPTLLAVRQGDQFTL